MGVLKIRVTGKENGKPWDEEIGKASNLAVGEVILEKIAPNYEKGNYLQVREKVKKRNRTHKTVETSGDKDKNTVSSLVEIWQIKEIEQQDMEKDQTGIVRKVWHWVATLSNPLDAKKALPGIAAITPDNSVLVIGGVDDNQDWEEGFFAQGRDKTTGGLSADEAPETPKKHVKAKDAPYETEVGKGEPHYPTKLKAVK